MGEHFPALDAVMTHFDFDEAGIDGAGANVDAGKDFGFLASAL